MAPPAGAHSAKGADASNFRTRLLSVTPQLPGIDVAIIENGNRMQVTNTTDEDLIVLGYQGEPYLRVGPDGVAENLRSPATYLNRDRKGETAVPGSADPDAEPDWSQVGDGHTARWHDHRVHWMGAEDPRAVQQDPGRRHTVIPEWVVEMRVGDTAVEASGDLVWVPGPSVVPWWALTVAAFVVAAAATWSQAWRPAVAALVVALVALDVAHVLGVALAQVGGLGSQLVQVASGSVGSLAGWVAGVVAVILLVGRGEAHRHEAGALAAALAGLLIGVNGGLVDVGELGRSQIQFAWPDAVFRATTALSLGLGFGIAAGVAVRILRQAPRLAAESVTTSDIHS